VRVLIAQLNPTIGDLEGNSEKIISALREAKARRIDLLITPEMALTGYPPEDFLLMPHFMEAVERQLERIVKETDGVAAIVGLPRRNPHRYEKELFNSAAVIADGKLLGYQDKTLLPTYDVFDERRYFEPSEKRRFWMLAGRRVAVTICEDIWHHAELIHLTRYRHDPVDDIKALTPDLVVNLSASPFAGKKIRERLTVAGKVAESVGCPLLLCNQVGGNDSLIFDGHSLFADSDGKLRQMAKGFDEELMIVDLEQKALPLLEPHFDMPKIYFEALVLGLRDYCRKCGFSKACFGLSGGIDSAVVACIAKEALGAENVLALALPSRYSSSSSTTDAKQLAENLGIACWEMSIEGPFEALIKSLSQHLPVEGVTEENLQPRIRGAMIMAVSNELGHIVLSTGNKSELAMGYSTLYGDMVGGLGVLCDVTKQRVYEIARYINREGELVPENILTKPPSAELRPDQKDSDSLPDYEIVDTVLEEYIENHLSPEKIAEKHDYPPELVGSLVGRIHLNEYKRRQGAPGLRISSKAFSVGRRFPIVQRFV